LPTTPEATRDVILTVWAVLDWMLYSSHSPGVVQPTLQTPLMSAVDSMSTPSLRLQAPPWLLAGVDSLKAV
jgi:hypothetical protein